MYELQRVRADHEAAILEFERANRDFFTLTISDRGDEYFREFAERHRELLRDQATGLGAFFVLVDDDHAVVGRFNLYDLTDTNANVGYRLARRVSGHGVASAGLIDLCRIAGDDLGLQTLTATTTLDNVASRSVLERAGFVVVGPAKIGDRDASTFQLTLNSR